MAHEIPYVLVAIVARLADGQLVAVRGQAQLVETSLDLETRSGGFRTTVEWCSSDRFIQYRMPDQALGVQVLDDGDEQFCVEPVLEQGEIRD